jgi:hypothetical protein
MAIQAFASSRIVAKRIWHRVCLYAGVDWGVVDIARLQGMRCPSCRGALGGGLMRQVEWSSRRCVVVVVCPACMAECLAILDTRLPRATLVPPLDVDDVRRAHELLAERDWQVSELFAA